jgi:hypothetical protein
MSTLDSLFEPHYINKGFPETVRSASPVLVTKDGFVVDRFGRNDCSFHSGYVSLSRELTRRAILLPLRYGVNLSVFSKDLLIFENSWSGGYYHWLIEALPRLISLRDRFGKTVLAFSGRSPNPWFNKWLKDISSDCMINYSGRGGVLASSAIFCQNPKRMSTYHSGQLHDAAKYLKETLRQYCSDGSSIKKIYITRRTAGHRKFVNEDVAESYFKLRGYVSFELERLSFPEQVLLFSNATHVASIHGAGLSNIIFMQPGASVIEMIQQPHIERTWGSRRGTHLLNPCFRGLADVFNLNYFAVLKKPCLLGDNLKTKNKYGLLHSDLIFNGRLVDEFASDYI